MLAGDAMHPLGCSAHPSGPDDEVGRATLAFVHGAPWILRRIDTVTFLDVDSLLRRSTVDVQQDDDVRIFSRLGGPPPSGSPRATLAIPVAILRKDLLAGFDVRDARSDALSVVSRDEDSFCSWSALLLVARRVKPSVSADTARAVAQHLYDIVNCFPETGPSAPPLPTIWGQPNTPWSDDAAQVWIDLLKDDDFRRLLLEFTFNFVLMVRHPEQLGERCVIKFAYREWLDAYDGTVLETLGLQSTIFPVQTPTAGTVASYHLQCVAPNGVVLTDLMLLRTQNSSVDNATKGQYHRRLGIDVGQVYTTDVAPANYSVAAFFRAPVAGHLRALWITSWIVALTLSVGFVFRSRLERLMDADAAVGVLLVAPTLVTAYLLRPDEHLLAAQLLRFPRYASGLAGLASMTSAAVIALGFRGRVLLVSWAVAASVAIAAAIYLTAVVASTRRDLTSARESVGWTSAHDVVDATPTS